MRYNKKSAVIVVAHSPRKLNLASVISTTTTTMAIALPHKTCSAITMAAATGTVPQISTLPPAASQPAIAATAAAALIATAAAMAATAAQQPAAKSGAPYPCESERTSPRRATLAAQ